MRRVALPLLLLLALLGGVPRAWSRGAAPRPAEAPRHVVLVILGGGVRSRDMLDAGLMPTLAALGEQGAVLRDVASGAPDGYAACARILTGTPEVLDGATKPRPAQPTICEYVRAGRHLPREQVWYVSFEGTDQLHLAHSTHADHGEVLGPSETWGPGPFAGPLAGFLEALGRPLPVEPATWEHLRRLRLLSRQAASVWLPKDVDAGLPRAERVERALLAELDRKALLLRGPNPRDAQAVRAALTVLAVHRPVLTVVRLGEAEQGQASYDAYRQVLAADDQGLARLLQAVADDDRMQGRTTFVVVADRGRNEAPDAQGRLGADDASKQRGRVAAVLAGPGLRRRPRTAGPHALEDLCPTLGELLDVPTPHATGSPWSGLLVER